jgi:predicted nucleotidyltransferase
MTPTNAARHPAVEQYLADLVAVAASRGQSLVSIALFGSAASGSFSTAVSDVDTIVVVEDGATDADRARLLREIADLERAHGLRPPLRAMSAFTAFAERSAGEGFSTFVCTRSDLLSGDVGRILGLRPAEVFFVDNIVLANIIGSARTIAGEDLLARVPLKPIRRLDVLKSFFAAFGHTVAMVAAFPLLPDATKYQIGKLKRSLHSCFFCYERRAAPVEEEIAFFTRRHGHDPALADLSALREHYRKSWTFVVRCLPTLVRLYFRTARDNAF